MKKTIQKHNRGKVRPAITALVLVLILNSVMLAFSGCAGKTESFTLPTRAYTEEDGLVFGSYTYKNYDDGTVGITEYSGTESDVIIPDTIDGKKVVTIGREAFADNTAICSVVLNSSLETVGDFAFAECTSLSEVKINKKLWSVGADAFISTPWLTAQSDEFVIVGNGILLLYRGKDKCVTLPDEVRHISSAFGYNEDIFHIELGDKVLSVGNYAFKGCQNLRYVKLGENLRIIGNYAFEDCVKLSSLTIPDRVEAIGAYAFNYCGSLFGVHFGSSLKSIGMRAFDNCFRLLTVDVPQSLTYVGEKAFPEGFSLSVVFYSGSEEQYAAIPFGNTNTTMTEAEIIYVGE